MVRRALAKQQQQHTRTHDTQAKTNNTTQPAKQHNAKRKTTNSNRSLAHVAHTHLGTHCIKQHACAHHVSGTHVVHIVRWWCSCGYGVIRAGRSRAPTIYI